MVVQKAWVALLEMEKYNDNVEDMDGVQSRWWFIWPTPLSKLQLKSGTGSGDELWFPAANAQGTLLVLSAPAKGDIRRLCGRSAADHHGTSSCIEVELSASSDCAPGRVERKVLKVYPLLKLKALADDVRKTKLKLSLTEEGKQGRAGSLRQTNIWNRNYWRCAEMS